MQVRVLLFAQNILKIMRTEKELLILLRKELLKKYNKGERYLFLCNITDTMTEYEIITTKECCKLKELIYGNRILFANKFNAIKDRIVLWDGDDFHNRYQALSYLIERYEEMDGMNPIQQKEHMASIASFKRIVLNYIKMLKIK